MREAHVLPFQRIDGRFGRFDSVVMFGNNFGLFGSAAGARRLLRQLYGLTSERGRIVAESLDLYATGDPDHLAYHERNRARGRMAGQLRLRVRHRGYATPWFDYLIVSRDELRELAAGSGWRVRRFVEPEGALYVVVLEKKPGSPR